MGPGSVADRVVAGRLGAVTREFAFIDRLVARLPGPPAGEVWAGDDCAVLAAGRLVAVDTVVDGTHFDLRWCTAADAAWKAVAVNVSDVAAMGGDPEVIVAAVTVPPDRPGVADGVADGLVAACAELGVDLVGGDTTSGPVLTITVTILGSVPEGAGPVLRSGARPGDHVFVTGPLGLAASALDALLVGRQPPSPEAAARLHRPQPRVVEGRAARRAGATAMIDVSDGLSADLGHLCDASGLGVDVVGADVPVAVDVELERALTAGDDYELCFTSPDVAAVERSFHAAGLAAPRRIGVLTPGPDRRLLLSSERAVPLPSGGWEHDLG